MWNSSMNFDGASNHCLTTHPCVSTLTVNKAEWRQFIRARLHGAQRVRKSRSAGTPYGPRRTMIRFARFEIGHTPPKLPLWVGAQPPASTHIWLCVAVSIYYIYNTPNHTQAILYYIETLLSSLFLKFFGIFFIVQNARKSGSIFVKITKAEPPVFWCLSPDEPQDVVAVLHI